MQRRFGTSWGIVYIRGKEGFQENVLLRLRANYLSGNSEVDHLIMVWVPDVDKLRSLKWAVGTTTIFKYRLHFSTSFNPDLRTPGQHATVFPAIEGEMVNPMVIW